MSILVVGSVALDHVETPFGCVDEALGGGASFHWGETFGVDLRATYYQNAETENLGFDNSDIFPIQPRLEGTSFPVPDGPENSAAIPFDAPMPAPRYGVTL